MAGRAPRPPKDWDEVDEPRRGGKRPASGVSGGPAAEGPIGGPAGEH
jgi:hypothetical protein